MTMTVTDIDSVSRIEDKAEARSLALAAYAALFADLERLSAEEWEAATVCHPWTVADIARHVLGAAKSASSDVEMARQQFHGFRHRGEFDGNPLDATNAHQVDQHRHLHGREIVEALRAAAPAAVSGRLSKPAFVDRIGIRLAPGGSSAPGMPAKVRLGELFRVTYTRDVWLHRLDIARALGRPMPLERDVDGRIVEDVVKDWADRHGRPFDLELTGGLESRYRRPGDGPTIELDAAELCWILSGRGEPDVDRPGAELLGYRVLF